MLPLAALIFGASALGGEIEDGTAVYLLTTPIARRRILLVKIAVASAATIAVALPATVVTSMTVLAGDAHALTAAFAVAVAVGAVVYCSIFVALSVRTSHALLIGLAYVFVWEAIVTASSTGRAGCRCGSTCWAWPTSSARPPASRWKRNSPAGRR